MTVLACAFTARQVAASAGNQILALSPEAESTRLALQLPGTSAATLGVQADAGSIGSVARSSAVRLAAVLDAAAAPQGVALGSLLVYELAKILCGTLYLREVLERGGARWPGTIVRFPRDLHPAETVPGGIPSGAALLAGWAGDRPAATMRHDLPGTRSVPERFQAALHRVRTGGNSIAARMPALVRRKAVLRALQRAGMDAPSGARRLLLLGWHSSLRAVTDDAAAQGWAVAFWHPRWGPVPLGADASWPALTAPGAFRRLVPDPASVEAAFPPGLGSEPALTRTLHSWITHLVESSWRDAQWGAHWARRITERWRPAALVGGAPYAIPMRAASLAFAELGIPRVVLQHGGRTGYDHNGLLWYAEGQYADVYMAYGTSTAEALAAQWQPRPRAPRVLAAGSPGLVTASRQRRPRTELRHVLYTRTALVGSHFYAPAGVYEDVYYHTVQCDIVAALSRHSKLTLTLRPADDDKVRSPLEAHAKSLGPWHIARRGGFADCLAACDLAVIDWPSTTLLEALAAGVPTVAYLDPNFTAFTDVGLSALRESCVVFDTRRQLVDGLRDLAATFEAARQRDPDIFLMRYGVLPGGGERLTDTLREFLAVACQTPTPTP